MGRTMLGKSIVGGMVCAAMLAAVPAPAAPPSSAAHGQAPASARLPARPASQPMRHAGPAIDRSGHSRVGKASVYSRRFDGRRMADGSRMDPRSDSAASKTLPLGTVAKVTNLRTGQSAVVTVRDRGPHVAGRIVDLSPASAQQVGIDRREGVARVAVTPLSLPPR